MIKYDMLYTAFSIVCIVLYIIFDKKTKKIQPIDIVMILILIIISGIRCNVGSDYYSYMCHITIGLLMLIVFMM